MTFALLRRAARPIALVASMLLISGCVARPNWTKPAPARFLPETVSEAKEAAVQGKYDHAEQRLVTFARKYPETREASETAFWRALLRLDPANPKASHREAAELLDRYLASPQPLVHEADARMLRRTALMLEQQSKSARTESETRTKERDEELQRTKDELANALAELERIKRRIASPKP